MENTICVEVNGVPVVVDRAAIMDDIETVELLADIDEGNPFKIVRLMKHVFGDAQYTEIKKSLAKDGRTAVSDMVDFMGEVFAALGDTAKN